MQNIEKLVPDTSVIIEGLLSKRLGKELKIQELIIHEAVLSELEHQANQGKEIGLIGLEELKNLRNLSKKFDFSIRYAGKKPKFFEIKNASLGEIDSLIRDLAYDESSTLITGDKVQSEVALAKGIDVIYIEPEIVKRKLKLEKYFDEITMSVHLRENLVPSAKKGMPGNWEFVHLGDKVLTQKDVQDISKEIIEEAKIRRDGFIEIERRGSSIVQLGNFRIVITRPPFSDAWEITAVKPIKKLNLEDYNLDPSLRKRIEEKAEGILIAGSPGEGKCLDGNEIIYTKNFEAIKVKDFYNYNKNMIYSINKKGKFIKEVIINKSKRNEDVLYELKTRTGRKIRVTKEHPLLVFRDNLKWVSVKDLNINDKIAVVRHININSSDSFDFLKFYNPENTLCKLDTDREIPIYYRYLHTKRKILYYLYSKSCGNKEEISNCINCSPKHTLRLLNELVKIGVIRKENKNYYIKKISFNLKDHNFILLKDIEELNIDKNYITHVEVIINKYKNKFNFIKIPKKINSDLCKFLGYILSEGGGSKVSFSNTNTRLVEDFKKSAYNAFRIKNWKKYNYSYYIDWKNSLEPILRNFGYLIREKKKSRNMYLPSFLYNCSLKNLKNFIRAYFDGDGGVNIRSRSIEFYTSSEETANQLVILLLRLDVYSYIHKKHVKGANRFTIKIFDIRSIKNFVKEIKPLSKDKYAKLKKCLNKKYSQTICYDINPLLKNIKKYIKLKIKPSISIDRIGTVLEELYKVYYNYSSKNSNVLYILKEYIERLEKMQELFKKNESKLTYSTLRNNSMDHNCIKHWNKDRKIKISTLNKVISILGYDLDVSPDCISNIISNALESSNMSIAQLSKDIRVNNGTIQLRLIHGWSTKIEELKEVYEKISLAIFNTKKEMEGVINHLEILCNSDILFDEVIEINKIEGNFEVYDFETRNHNFICGKLPLMIHNSTFASALAEFYANKKKIVKTIEAPRDLQLTDNITQYSINYGTSQEIHDILLLSRPDYTIFDEMRNIEDFRLFADLRLSGIGIVGVIHATNPIDAIQRFIGKLDTGMIPSILDTILFIKSGRISKILTVNMTVKVPSGMTEADLARPVVEIHDFSSQALEYEIYSYGEETVVVPVVSKKMSPLKLIAQKKLEESIKKYCDDAQIEIVSDNKVVVYAPENMIARLIGKQGKNISEIEKKVGISIDVRPLEESVKDSIPFEIFESKRGIVLKTHNKYNRRIANVFLEDELLFSTKISKNSDILINKKSELGRKLLEAINLNKKIEIKV